MSTFDEESRSGSDIVTNLNTFNRNLHVSKVVDVSFTKDGDRQYRVCWKETWEKEEELLSTCKELLREYWEKHLIAHIQQEIKDTDCVNKIGTEEGFSQESTQKDISLDNELHSPAFNFPENCASDISKAHLVPQEKQLKPQEICNDLPEQYRNVGFAKSVREQFSSNLLLTSQTDFVEQILSKPSELTKLKPTLDEVKKQRELTIQRFVSFKKGSRVKCDICVESFADRKSMIRHKINHHDKFSPHQCTVCHKTFLKPSDIRRHMSAHSDLRQYKCTHCDNCYKTQNHLQRHIKAKHNSSGKEPNNDKSGHSSNVLKAFGCENVLKPMDHSQSLNDNTSETVSNPMLNSEGNFLLSEENTILETSGQFVGRADSVPMCLIERGFFK